MAKPIPIIIEEEVIDEDKDLLNDWLLDRLLETIRNIRSVLEETHNSDETDTSVIPNDTQ